MTIVPTVRHQLEEAAKRYAGEPVGRRARPRLLAGRHEWVNQSADTGASRPARAGRVSSGTVALAVGIVVSLAVAVTGIVLLARTRPATTSSVGHQPHANPGVEKLLAADGIGTIRFGQSPSQVATALQQRLGTPSSASAPGSTGLRKSICGFDHEIDWYGLAVKTQNPQSASGAAGAQTIVSAAELEVYFRHTKFAGYAYYEARILKRDARRGAAAGPRLLTPRGLGLGDTLAHARELYGSRFSTFEAIQGTPPNPRLPRGSAWKTATPEGRIFGGVQTTPPQQRITNQSTIAEIAAGAIPNTPCKAGAHSPRTS
jgi:hypothetical protein